MKLLSKKNGNLEGRTNNNLRSAHWTTQPALVKVSLTAFRNLLVGNFPGFNLPNFCFNKFLVKRITETNFQNQKIYRQGRMEHRIEPLSILIMGLYGVGTNYPLYPKTFALSLPQGKKISLFQF